MPPPCCGSRRLKPSAAPSLLPRAAGAGGDAGPGVSLVLVGSLEATQFSWKFFLRYWCRCPPWRGCVWDVGACCPLWVLTLQCHRKQNSCFSVPKFFLLLDTCQKVKIQPAKHPHTASEQYFSGMIWGGEVLGKELWRGSAAQLIQQPPGCPRGSFQPDVLLPEIVLLPKIAPRRGVGTWHPPAGWGLRHRRMPGLGGAVGGEAHAVIKSSLERKGGCKPCSFIWAL